MATNKAWKKDLIELIFKLIFIAGVFLVSLLFIFGVTVSPDDSMSQAVKPGDIVFYYRMNQKYTTDSVIVLEKKGDKQVRRIVAGPGDEVAITDEGLMVNGNLRTNPEITHPTLPYKGKVKYPLKLQANQYFVLGDYRMDVADSREYGVVNQREIKGSVMTIIRTKRF